MNIKLPDQLKEDILTVGQLLDFIASNNISREALVFSQKTFDAYFEKLNWPIVEQEGDKSQSNRGD